MESGKREGEEGRTKEREIEVSLYLSTQRHRDTETQIETERSLFIVFNN